jgi:hypothetical protein
MKDGGASAADDKSVAAPAVAEKATIDVEAKTKS